MIGIINGEFQLIPNPIPIISQISSLYLIYCYPNHQVAPVFDGKYRSLVCIKGYNHHQGTSTITPLSFLVNPDMFNSEMLVFELFILQNITVIILIKP